MENDNRSKELAYSFTNESLGAVVHGLNPQKNDSILAICGSGDQAFALLEKAQKIIVVDSLPESLRYFAKRKDLLKTGEFERFLDPEEILMGRDLKKLKIRNKYFSDKRLKRIQAKLKDSDLVKKIRGDLFDLNFPKEGFDKIYLSNVLSYSLKHHTIELAQGRLKELAEWLSNQGLIYLSDYKLMIKRVYGDDKSFLKPLGLIVNEELTAEAQRLEEKAYSGTTWGPAVLQKSA